MNATARTPVHVGSRLVALLAAALLVVGLGAMPAEAQQHQQRGLVNVNVSEVVVQVPIAVAANLCDVAVNALAQQKRTGDVECNADAESDAVFENGNGDAPHQRGLVNVNISDVTIQVPVSVAANICGVAVNVLARQMHTGEVECDAFADADAS